MKHNYLSEAAVVATPQIASAEEIQRAVPGSFKIPFFSTTFPRLMRIGGDDDSGAPDRCSSMLMVHYRAATFIYRRKKTTQKKGARGAKEARSTQRAGTNKSVS